MAKVTLGFGTALIILSAIAFFELQHLHTVIPAIFGILLAICGVRARNPDPKKRMLFMHVAVTIAVIGFLGTIPGIIATIRRAAGQVVLNPVVDAAVVQTIMGTICLIYVVFCVQSFIAIRRSRTESPAEPAV